MKRVSMLFLCVFVAALGAAWPQDGEQVCANFLRWLKARPPESDPRKIVAGYRVVLLDSVLSEVAVDDQMEVVWRCAFRHPEGARLLWNKVYAGDEPIFREAPNRLLVDFVQDRPPGRALDFGIGQGRNALYLALNGWEVTGFDPSDETIRIAQTSARTAGVKIDTAVAADEEFDFGRERWDLIVITYVRVLTAKDAERMWRSLRPGGLVVYENAAVEDNRLLTAFKDFRILRFEDVLDYPDWSPGEKVRLQRLVAQKSE